MAIFQTYIESGDMKSLQSELAKTSAPTSSDDTNAGYDVGSLWIDTTNDKVYQCVDATASAAVWKDLTDTGTGAGPFDRQHDINWRQPTSSPPSEVQSGYFRCFELVGTGASIKEVIADMNLDREVLLGSVNPVVQVFAIVTTTGGGDGDAKLTLNVRYIATGESATKTVDETLSVTKTITNTLDLTYDFTFTLDRTKMAASDKVSMELGRNPADAADTYSGHLGIAIGSSRLEYSGS